MGFTETNFFTQSLDQMLPDYASKENFPSKIFLGKIFVSLFFFFLKLGKL